MSALVPQLALLGLLGTLSAGASAAESVSERVIQGTVTVHPDFRGHLCDSDRLVFKIYHLRRGVEMDTTYRIHAKAEFPFAFSIGPSVDMNGRTRWRSYRVEVLTDKDRDVLSLAAGELVAKSDAAVPLGTRGLNLVLDALRTPAAANR